MSSNEFPISDQNRIRQSAKRASYDEDTVHRILDQNLVCQVAFVQDDKPFAIPMFFARRQNELLFHGSTKSRLMQSLTSGQSICISVTLVDGLVLAKSLFHHSMNYRSVTIFGTGYALEAADERMEALRIITDKTMPGRWDDARQPGVQEMKATLIAAVKIDSASAKVRTGGPVEDSDDVNLPFWSGVVPIHRTTSSPIPAVESEQLAVPGYIDEWRKKFDHS